MVFVETEDTPLVEFVGHTALVVTGATEFTVTIHLEDLTHCKCTYCGTCGCHHQ